MRRYVQTTFGEVELHLYHRRERALRLARRLGASVTFVENAHAQTNGFDSGDDLVQNVTYALLDMHRRWARGHPIV